MRFFDCALASAILKTDRSSSDSRQEPSAWEFLRTDPMSVSPSKGKNPFNWRRSFISETNLCSLSISSRSSEGSSDKQSDFPNGQEA